MLLLKEEENTIAAKESFRPWLRNNVICREEKHLYLKIFAMLSIAN